MAVARQQRIDPRTIERRAQQKRAAKKVKPATLGTWIAGARPQTLPLAIVPVALGFAAAFLNDGPPWYEHWARALLCLAVALFLQIGVNYANDYSDGVRGTDRDRIGPQRLVGSGRAKPGAVLAVAIVFFVLAAVAGGIVIWQTQQWWLIAVGAVCILAAWFYTGGKRPYGYLPLGELAVLVFFGVVPTAGTTFVLSGTVNVESWIMGACAGLFAAAVLLANNLRDRDRDKLHGKRTLSVLIGGTASRILYAVLVLVPFLALVYFVLFYDNTGYVYFALLAALPAILICLTAKTARELVIVLQLTLLTALLWGLGLAALIIFG